MKKKKKQIPPPPPPKKKKTVKYGFKGHLNSGGRGVHGI